MERIVAYLAMDGLGWLAINEVARISNLPYCLGVKNYKERKTFFRSYAEGTFVFEVPEYFADRFGKIWNAPCDCVNLYDSLPKTIPSEIETRLLDLLDDEEYVKEMKKYWLGTQKLGIVGWFEKFLFWLGK